MGKRFLLIPRGNKWIGLLSEFVKPLRFMGIGRQLQPPRVHVAQARADSGGDDLGRFDFRTMGIHDADGHMLVVIDRAQQLQFAHVV